MDKQIKEELTKIYEQIGALLSTDESDKIKKFGTMRILGAAVPAPKKPYCKGDVLGYNGTDFGIGDTVPGKEITWLKLGDIWVCDRNILQDISWETLNKKGFVFGKEIEIDNEKYTLRILTGSDGEDYGKGCGNEWDHLTDEYDEDNDILHFYNMYSWCQETYYNNASDRSIRGYNSGRSCNCGSTAITDEIIGWRPVLEKLNRKGKK